jgi:hypothetical protein
MVLLLSYYGPIFYGCRGVRGGGSRSPVFFHGDFCSSAVVSSESTQLYHEDGQISANLLMPFQIIFGQRSPSKGKILA